MRLIDADDLNKTLGIDSGSCSTCSWGYRGRCSRGCDFEDACCAIEDAPTIDAVEVVRCKDCIYGHLYIDVQNEVTDSWIECRNPEGLNRDVSIDGYCSASTRKT